MKDGEGWIVGVALKGAGSFFSSREISGWNHEIGREGGERGNVSVPREDYCGIKFAKEDVTRKP